RLLPAGHRDDRDAPGREQASQPRGAEPVVLEVLEHLGADGEIEGGDQILVVEIEAVAVEIERKDTGSRAACRGLPAALRREIGPGQASTRERSPELDQELTLAATDVDDRCGARH